MSNLAEIVEKVEAKVDQLLKKNQHIQQENTKLKELIEQENIEIKQLKQEISRLNLVNKNLKTANALLGSNEYKRETKLKINSLIKEIDECIVQLAE
ncbi:hypothetical protein [Psychroflexus sp. ALD_RP9]|uniref:hypothetical protein n=1 Tax=Psychroflexus sp. ALD_RP9 TaxID=2777186 RepID=UPI001A8EE99F|nr:hypothetical protein [Psychroflexus sp. ALD_RP9]QSS97177.1 hypothetical protein IMZ30_00205 [Psychroflexus sp. ALD_RP9]